LRLERRLDLAHAVAAIGGAQGGEEQVPPRAIGSCDAAVVRTRTADDGFDRSLQPQIARVGHLLGRMDMRSVIETGARFLLDAYRKHLGAGPRGWRAPSFAFSKHSLRYLLDAGFEYDSSLMGDDVPYALRDGNASLLEFPVDWTLDDFPHYAHNRDLGYRMPISSPQRAMEVFRSEFDAAREFGALWISVWHPALSGRLARFKAVLELLDYMRAKRGV